MMELIERPSTTDEIIVHIHMINGEVHIQPLPFDNADGAIDLLHWFRNKKGGDVWTWQSPMNQSLSAIHRRNIVAISVYNFIEPEANVTKWYQRIMDKYRTWKITR